MTAVADSSSPWNQVDNADPYEAGFTNFKTHNIDKYRFRLTRQTEVVEKIKSNVIST